MSDPARMPPTQRPAALSPAARPGTATAPAAAPARPLRQWLAGASDRVSSWMGLHLRPAPQDGRAPRLSQRHATVATARARAFAQANDACVRQRITARLTAECAARTQVPGSVNALIHLSEEHATAAMRRTPASPWTTRELTEAELAAIVEAATGFAQRLLSARSAQEMHHVLESKEH